MSRVQTDTDVVVIGAGACGLAAAVTLAESGAKVIIFEKQRAMGGSSNFFAGMFAAESDMQRAQFIDYTRDKAFKNIMEYSHWRANPRIVRAFVNESAASIAWLINHGVEFREVMINMPDAPRTYHVVKGKGEALVKAIATRAKEKGVDIRLATPVKRILKEGNRITGVIVEQDGEDKQVTAKAVIIATGGYANNKEWQKKYAGFDLGVNLIAHGNVDKVGDGIRMAWEAGAAEDGLGVQELIRSGPMGPEFSFWGEVRMLTNQPDLWVNPRGERFCDERIAYYDTSHGNANARFKEGYTFSIFDDGVIKRLMEYGLEKNAGMDNLPGTRPANLDKVLKDELEKGTSEIFEANSIEELAKKLKMNPAVLKATVDEYNRFCEKGHDDLFAKEPRYLRPIRGPKFYAIRVRTVTLGTLGGIKINDKMEVVDKKDEVIPGLYAGGEDAAGMWGDSYPIDIASGGSSAFAVTSGRIAAKNALGYIAK